MLNLMLAPQVGISPNVEYLYPDLDTNMFPVILVKSVRSYKVYKGETLLVDSELNEDVSNKVDKCDIEQNEFVVSAALNDINNRIGNAEELLSQI